MIENPDNDHCMRVLFGGRYETKMAQQKGDLELWEHLPSDITGPIERGLIDDLTPENPNENILIPVIDAGVSLSGKSFLGSQRREKIRRDERVIAWQKEHRKRLKRYFMDTGMTIRVARNLGVVVSPQGKMIRQEYTGMSDIAEELAVLGLEYLPGPGTLDLEFVLVTADENDGRLVGTLRGSMRLTERLITNCNGRLLVYSAPEGLKDETGEFREKARGATSEELAELVAEERIKHSAEDSVIMMAYYLLSSNKLTREQQNKDVAWLTWLAIKAGKIIIPYKFNSFNAFYKYYLIDHPDQWFLVVNQQYTNWISNRFKKPYGLIDPRYGCLVLNTPLDEDEDEEPESDLTKLKKRRKRHLFDKEMAKADLVEALRVEAQRTRSGNLSNALRRLGVLESPSIFASATL